MWRFLFIFLGSGGVGLGCGPNLDKTEPLSPSTELTPSYSTPSTPTVPDHTDAIEEACRAAEQACESECRFARIKTRDGRRVRYSNFKRKCEDACEDGKSACERDKSPDWACRTFERECSSDCPNQIYDRGAGEYLYFYASNAEKECEDACDDGQRTCNRHL
jgi:hypothetical protein